MAESGATVTYAELPVGEIGMIWFVGPAAADPARTADGSADLAGTRGRGTVSDLGRVDEDGSLYLTGRTGQTIISGGVNIHPREFDDLLVLHPAVADVAVVGVPDEEFGEQVKGVVQVADGYAAGPELAGELIAYTRGTCLISSARAPSTSSTVCRAATPGRS
jgi:acyl-coenzyme A synthetase/AMP-(fatty) acid ligase